MPTAAVNSTRSGGGSSKGNGIDNGKVPSSCNNEENNQNYNNNYNNYNNKPLSFFQGYILNLNILSLNSHNNNNKNNYINKNIKNKYNTYITNNNNSSSSSPTKTTTTVARPYINLLQTKKRDHSYIERVEIVFLYYRRDF